MKPQFSTEVACSWVCRHSRSPRAAFLLLRPHQAGCAPRLSPPFYYRVHTKQDAPLAFHLMRSHAERLCLRPFTIPALSMAVLSPSHRRLRRHDARQHHATLTVWSQPYGFLRSSGSPNRAAHLSAANHVKPSNYAAI